MKHSLIWGLVALYALFAAIKPLILDTAAFALVPAVSILVPVVFVLVHAPAEIGWRRLGLFFALAFAISWGYESASIATGFPFGHYHYTDKLGWKLGTVPLLIMPAYFGVCYISWLIARLILAAGRPAAAAPGPVATALTAAFVMVSWDLSMDPSRATVAQAWIWHDGGAYFGVPLVNFAGWFLCVLTIFLAYGALSRRIPAPATAGGLAAAAQALGLYAAIFLEFPSFAAFAPDGTVADATGQVWNLRDLYQTLGLVSVFSMGLVLLLGAVSLSAARRAGGDPLPHA